MLHVPAEHATHTQCVMAWPYRDDEWTDLGRAQEELRAFVLAIAETESVLLLVRPGDDPAIDHPRVQVLPFAFGDSWTRDSAPIFARRGGEEVALCFRFDGWGGKYPMEGDADLSERLAAHLQVPAIHHDFVLEGGALEFDGEGSLLVTPCLSLPNRAPPADLTERLVDAFGVEKLISFEGQLANDHTDGHVDTLARFVKPGEVVCMRGEVDDPNGAMLLAIEEQLARSVDARDRTLRVHTIPSPGAVVGEDGALLAASYCNYYLANDQLIVPTYGVSADARAVEALAALFPDRRVRGLSARWIIEGGGAFHCITQQRPA